MPRSIRNVCALAALLASILSASPRAVQGRMAGIPAECACGFSLFHATGEWKLCPKCGAPMDPVVRTAGELRTVAICAESYKIDHGTAPRVSGLDALVPLVEPIYVRALPRADAWGRPIHYAATGDGLRFAVASAGADGKLERPLAEVLAGKGERAGDDVLYLDGETLLPAGR